MIPVRRSPAPRAATPHHETNSAKFVSVCGHLPGTFSTPCESVGPPKTSTLQHQCGIYTNLKNYETPVYFLVAGEDGECGEFEVEYEITSADGRVLLFCDMAQTTHWDSCRQCSRGTRLDHLGLAEVHVSARRRPLRGQVGSSVFTRLVCIQPV